MAVIYSFYYLCMVVLVGNFNHVAKRVAAKSAVFLGSLAHGLHVLKADQAVEDNFLLGQAKAQVVVNIHILAG